jgi:hypothetical protein
MYSFVAGVGEGFCDACFTNRYPVLPGEKPKGHQFSLFGDEG